MKIRKIPVPFTSLRTGSTQSKSVESLNPNSVQTDTDVHPIQASSVDAQVQGDCVVNGPAPHSCASSQTVQMNQTLMSLLHPSQPSQPSQSNQATTRSASINVASSQPNQSKLPSSELKRSFSSSPQSVQVLSQDVNPGQSMHDYSPSSHCVPYFLPSAQKTQTNPHPSSNFQTRLPLTNKTASQINNISKLAKSRKTSTLHYYPSIAHPMPVNSQTPAPTHPTPINIQSPILTHPIPASNQTGCLTYSIPANNQTTLLTHPIPANNQSPLLTTLLTHQIPANSQTPVQTHPIPANNQTPIVTQPIPANNQTPILTHPILVNNQTPVLTHPVSNMPADTQTLILAYPIQTSFLGPMHSFAAQPNIPLAVLSTINTHSLNDVTAVSNVHSAEPSNCGRNHCSHNPCAQNTTSPTFKAIQSTTSLSSLPVNPISSAPISGNDTLWCKRDTYNHANLPVKALADSVCDQDAGVSSTNFTYTDHSESNLPTSTVSETDTKESSPDPNHSSGPPKLHQDSLSTTTTGKYSRQAQAGPSFTESDSRLKHWSVGMPTTFRQLVEITCTPVGSIDNQNNTPPANSTPCGTSEDLALEVGKCFFFLQTGVLNGRDLCFIQKFSFHTRG